MAISKEDKIRFKKCMVDKLTEFVNRDKVNFPNEPAPPCCMKKLSQQSLLSCGAQSTVSNSFYRLPCAAALPVDCCECMSPNNQSLMLNTSRSRELRGSILYFGCECEKKNGLQDDCLRSECQGNPVCLYPQPECGPSSFAGGKHLGFKFTTTIN